MCGAEGADLTACKGKETLPVSQAKAASANGITPKMAYDTLRIGNTLITDSGYWTTDGSGNLTASDVNNYNVAFDADTNTLTLNNATIVGFYDANSNPDGTGIYAYSRSGSVSLTIQVTGYNVVSGSVGICALSNGGEVSVRISGGGSLTASGNAGIQFWFGTGASGSGTPSLTVSGNATVDAKNGGITHNSSSNLSIQGDSGIVFNGSTGTVYGNASLQKDLIIGEGESLTLDNGASLDANGHNVIMDGGTVDDSIKNSLGDSVKYTPTITTTSLSNGTAEAAYSTTLLADGTAPITWSVTSGSLPEGLSLDASTGEISGTPMAEGICTFTVTAANDYGSDSREFTLNIEASAVISVTGVMLDKTSLTLQETGSDTLAAMVEPADATNKDVTWESSDTSIATVDANGKVTAISAGSAIITAIAAEGSGVSASCSVTVTHGNMVHTPKKDAACTADGNEEYWTCGTCGKIFSDEEGKTEIALEDTVISKSGHSYGAPVWSWSEDGKSCTVTFTCANDDSHMETLEVTVPSKIKKAATCTEKGVTEYTATTEFNGKIFTDTKEVADIEQIAHNYKDGKCTVCGAADPDDQEPVSSGDNTVKNNTAENNTVSKQENSVDAVQTGDMTNPAVWISLLTASVLILIGAVVLHKKTKRI